MLIYLSSMILVNGSRHAKAALACTCVCLQVRCSMFHHYHKLQVFIHVLARGCMKLGQQKLVSLCDPRSNLTTKAEACQMGLFSEPFPMISDSGEVWYGENSTGVLLWKFITFTRFHGSPSAQFYPLPRVIGQSSHEF